MANKIKKGDEVIILTGKDKGQRGVVNKVLPKISKVLVDNVNVVKKHVRPNPNAGVEGGIVEMEKPLHISNVAIFNPAKSGADKVGFKTLEDGRKVRIFKSSGETIDV
jgi:large subunit ribosomal protein L24